MNGMVGGDESLMVKVFSLQSQVSKSKDDPRVVTLKKSAISL